MNRLRVGKLVFRDPVLLCGVVYLLLYFDASGFLRLGLLAAVLHELGHISVYCIQQRRLPVIEVTMTGFCMRTAGEKLSPRQRLVLAAAGPAVNFALAGVWALRLAQAATIRGSAFWAANLLTGLFNLLPVPPLDGAQMAACAAALWRQKYGKCIQTARNVQRQLQALHLRLHIQPRHKGALTPPVLVAVEQLVQDLFAQKGHSHLVGVREAEGKAHIHLILFFIDTAGLAAGIAAGLLHPSQRFFQFGIKHRVLHKQSVFCVLFILPQMRLFCNRFRRFESTFRIFAARVPPRTLPSARRPAGAPAVD